MERLAEVGDFVDEIVSEIPPGLEYVGLENIESGAGDYSHAEEKDGISAARVFRAGQVLFSRLRPYLNKVALAKSGGVCSTEIYAIQARALRPEYLAAFLRSDIVLSQTEYMITGATLPRLQLADVKDLLIPILSEREQNRIIRVIEAARAKKEKTVRQARELLAQAGDFLLSELGIEMPAADRGAKVFYRQFSDFSGRWEPRFYLEQFMRLDSILESRADIRRIAEIADDIGSGSTPKAKGDAYTDAACGVPFVRVCDLKNREIDYENALRITRETHETVLKRSQLSKTDILLSIAGTIGLSVVVKDDYDANINQALARIALKSGEMTDAIYVSEVLNSPIGRLQTSRVSRPVVQANINLSEIGALKIPMPPMTERRKIVARILKIRAQADKIRAEAAESFRLAKLEVERIILKNQPRKNNE